jgi:hypothetical protein
MPLLSYFAGGLLTYIYSDIANKVNNRGILYARKERKEVKKKIDREPIDTGVKIEDFLHKVKEHNRIVMPWETKGGSATKPPIMVLPAD